MMAERMIALYRRREIVGFTLVDRDDFDALNERRWSLNTHRYAVTYTKEGRTQRMHKVIAGGALVDHINGDGLDNRRANLRLCTVQQNNLNRRMNKSGSRSGLKGVSWHARDSKWRARIIVPSPTGSGDGRVVCLGYFDDPSKAHAAYCAAALKYHGDFANDGNGPIKKEAP